jgi:Uma2 family endonuclease
MGNYRPWQQDFLEIGMSRRTTVAKPLFEAPRSSLADGSTPSWEVAYLFPAQGAWTEDDYLRLESACEGVAWIELSNGRLDVLPMPTELHQLILVYLFEMLKGFTQKHAPGLVLPAGIKVRLSRGKMHQPDIAYLKAEHADRRHEDYWQGADLVMQVVSNDPKDRERDWEVKPREYARAGIGEYWIIDPQQERVRVLKLKGKSYRVHGNFAPGAEATSVLLPGFAVAVDVVLAPPGSKDRPTGLD